MKNYDYETRNNALNRIWCGQPINKVAKEMNVSSTTLYKWRNSFINQFFNTKIKKQKNTKLKGELTVLNIKIYK